MTPVVALKMLLTFVYLVIRRHSGTGTVVKNSQIKHDTVIIQTIASTDYTVSLRIQRIAHHLRSWHYRVFSREVYVYSIIGDVDDSSPEMLRQIMAQAHFVPDIFPWYLTDRARHDLITQYYLDMISIELLEKRRLDGHEHDLFAEG